MMQTGLYAGNPENPAIRMPNGVVKNRPVQAISREGRSNTEPSEATRPALERGDDMVRAAWRHAEPGGTRNDLATSNMDGVTTLKPFEIHEIHMDVTGFFNNDGILQMLDPTPETLHRRVKLKITDFSKNETMNKNSTLISNMVMTNRKSWPLYEPYTIVRAEGFQVQVDTGSFLFTSFPTVAAGTAAIDRLRVEVNFQGFLIVVEKPSETR